MNEWDRHVLPSDVLKCWGNSPPPNPRRPLPMRRSKSISKTVSHATRRMSAFLTPSAAEYDASGLMRSRSFSEAQYEWREKKKLERYEEEYETPEKDGIRRNLSRRWSQTLRRSWGSRRSYVSGTTDEGSEEWDSEGTLRVKRVTRLRDWSDELDESDILAPNVEAPIIWAETRFDIGMHWRYISEED